MKKHLFYTFLAIFVATAVVTLLGVTGVIHVSDGPLTALITAFLVESAGAVVAIFRKADFFTDNDEQHAEAMARIQKQLTEMQERLTHGTSITERLQGDLQRAKDANAKLRATLEALVSLRLRVIALLGAESLNLAGVLQHLDLFANPTGKHEVMSVIGALVHDKTIESNPSMPAGYYRLRSANLRRSDDT